MSPVYIEDPLSFEIQKFIIGRQPKEGTIISVLDPDGYEIFGTLANIPQIGLTREPTPSHRKPVGFLGVATSNTQNDNNPNDPLRPTFEPEAILSLDVADIPLPKDVTDAWVLQVKNQKDEAFYVDLADLLSRNFNNVAIVVTSAFKDNPDPGCVDGVPVDPKYPKGAFFCPIGISRTIKKESPPEETKV